MHSDSCFLTLTYNDESLPTGATLNPKHLQDFLKRFRKAILPLKIRFFAVGEYGDESQRPHYHLAVFGYPTCSYGQTRSFKLSSGRPCCQTCSLVQNCWGKGQIYLGLLEQKSAQYIAGYVTKKMTRYDDPRLNGRNPEFARMSLRPGIGADAMHQLASDILQLDLESTQPDVPSALRHGKKLLPLGRYLRRKLRTLTGKDPKTPDEILQTLDKEMLPLRLAARSSKTHPTLKAQIIATNIGHTINLANREKIYKGKKSI